MITILDAKLADISVSCREGIRSAKKLGFDAVTVAPFAGNLESLVKHGKEFRIGVFVTCLMSNAEYKSEKEKWVNVDNEDEVNDYRVQDLEEIRDEFHVKQYVKIARDAARFGADGVVVGAPSDENYIREDELKTVKHYVGDNTLVLMPGVGAQKGRVESVWNVFGKEQVIVSISRGLMIHNGNYLTPAQRGVAARKYAESLNAFRKI